MQYECEVDKVHGTRKYSLVPGRGETTNELYFATQKVAKQQRWLVCRKHIIANGSSSHTAENDLVRLQKYMIKSLTQRPPRYSSESSLILDHLWNPGPDNSQGLTV